MFYRFMEDDGIDWRNILYVINNQLVNRLSIRSDSKKSKLPVCLIIDDTDMPKTGTRIELMSWIHSHVLGKSTLGFKGLFLARTDSKTQTLLDCAVVGEDGDNPDRPHGMSKEQIGKQYSKVRVSDSHGQTRVNEYSMDKQTQLREMVAYAIKKGQRFDYLLVDSWFTCKELVHFIKRRHFNCHLLGMIKMRNTKYHSDKYGDLTDNGCIDKLQRIKKGIRYSRSLNCYYGEMEVMFDTMRWAIEVSFEEMKDYLGLGKCQTHNFTAQIASVSQTMLQYNILFFMKRFDSYETIGGLFGEITIGTAELTIVDRVWLLIVEVVTEIAGLISADYNELIRDTIYGNSHLHAIFVHEYVELEREIFTCGS